VLVRSQPRTPLAQQRLGTKHTRCPRRPPRLRHPSPPQSYARRHCLTLPPDQPRTRWDHHPRLPPSRSPRRHKGQPFVIHHTSVFFFFSFFQPDVTHDHVFILTNPFTQALRVTSRNLGTSLMLLMMAQLMVRIPARFAPSPLALSFFSRD
jgi:hypothetical protein